MTKLFDKDITKGVIGNFLFWLICYGSAGVTSYYTAHSAYINGLPAYKAIPLGAGVFLVLALAANLFSLIVIRHRRHSRELASGTPTASTPSSYHCPDEWLHKIAESNRSAIYKSVRIEKCGLSGHALLDTAPYIDFSLTLFNSSVFKLTIDESLQGSISLNGQQFSKEARLRVGVSVWWRNSTALLVLRQWLSKEEATCILNAMGDDDEFRFYHLKFTVRGCEQDSRVEPHQPSLLHTKIPCKLLREYYPKLRTEIQKSQLKGFWNLSNAEVIGSYINLKVTFENPRPQEIDIRNFKIRIKAKDKTYVKSAAVGEIRETRVFDFDGNFEWTGERLKNLNEPPITVEQGQKGFGG